MDSAGTPLCITPQERPQTRQRLHGDGGVAHGIESGMPTFSRLGRNGRSVIWLTRHSYISHSQSLYKSLPVSQLLGHVHGGFVQIWHQLQRPPFVGPTMGIVRHPTGTARKWPKLLFFSPYGALNGYVTAAAKFIVKVLVIVCIKFEINQYTIDDLGNMQMSK